METAEDQPIARPTAEPIGAIHARLLSRRQLLQGIASGVALAGLGACNRSGQQRPAGESTSSATTGPGSLSFEEIPAEITTDHMVAPGYSADVLLRWGDPVLPTAPPFLVAHKDASAQAQQFGYNNDFLAFMPLPQGSRGSDHGLLCCNHEYTDRELMWPGVRSKDDLDEAQVRVEMAAHGHSVVEVRRGADGKWQPVAGSPRNRRITPSTPMRIAGPAAGHVRMQTSADPEGTLVLGTVNNCAGGTTPWGTVLIAEENFHNNFLGDPEKAADNPLDVRRLERLGLTGAAYSWGRFERRFDIEQEPNEPNRFGWIVEYDPYDPESVPVKRTALGRCKHEGATPTLAPDGRVVLYTGDDQAGEYLYRFVSEGHFDPANREANRDLLDRGTLAVARFHDDGTMEWRPLVHGQGPLVASNGFASQADVVIDARRAADAVGATPLDRPEDIEVSPTTGRVYVMLTKNPGRTADEVDAANPRGPNLYGHILELLPPGEGTAAAEHASETFRWEILLMGGDPSVPEHGAAYHPATTRAGAVYSCDNAAFDPQGRLWIATDQGSGQVKSGVPDGIRACEVTGEHRALTKLFYRVPVGAEMCGPCFTPDGTTLFVAVQHPGEGKHPDLSRVSTFDDPSTRWPDFTDGTPPRPSVVAITREGAGPIGAGPIGG